MGLNFKFGCTQSQLASIEPLFASVDSTAGSANSVDFADPLVNLLAPWFDFDMLNFPCFEKLTTMFFLCL